jgi:hypothetical protein
MSTALKAIHDQLLAEQPEGAVHDEQTCPFCVLEALEASGQEPEGGLMGQFTQEELDAAIAAATTPLQTRLAELEAAAQETEVGKAVADATEPLNTRITELEGQLDATTIEKAAAEEAKTKVEEFWATAVAEHEAATVAAARRDERLTKLKEVAPEKAHEYLESNADRFAAMADEDFDARIEEYRAIAAKEGGSDEIPVQTALVAARESAAPANGSMLGEIPNLRRALDPRTL